MTTQIYLHALSELEMHTRMALVPDGWEDPRAIPVDALPVNDDAEHDHVVGGGP